MIKIVILHVFSLLFLSVSAVLVMTPIVQKALKIMCNFNINHRIALGYCFVQVILIIMVRGIFHFFNLSGLPFNIIFILLPVVLCSIVYGKINNPNTQRPIGIGKGFVITIIPYLIVLFIALIVAIIFLIYCPHLRSGWSFGLVPILWMFLCAK